MATSPEYVDAVLTSPGMTYEDSQVHPTVQKLAGRQAHTFEQWVYGYAVSYLED